MTIPYRKPIAPHPLPPGTHLVEGHVPRDHAAEGVDDGGVGHRRRRVAVAVHLRGGHVWIMLNASGVPSRDVEDASRSQTRRTGGRPCNRPQGRRPKPGRRRPKRAHLWAGALKVEGRAAVPAVDGDGQPDGRAVVHHVLRRHGAHLGQALRRCFGFNGLCTCARMRVRTLCMRWVVPALAYWRDVWLWDTVCLSRRSIVTASECSHVCMCVCVCVCVCALAQVCGIRASGGSQPQLLDTPKRRPALPHLARRELPEHVPHGALRVGLDEGHVGLDHAQPVLADEGAHQRDALGVGRDLGRGQRGDASWPALCSSCSCKLPKHPV